MTRLGLLSLVLWVSGCSLIVRGKLNDKDDADGGGGRCDSNDDCSDEDVCNGRETCDASAEDADAEGCVSGTPLADETACDFDGNGDTNDGYCIAEDCQLSVCGDEIVDEDSEECDDGNDTFGDGCDPDDCGFSCNTAADCVAADDACDGTDLCDEDRRCVPAGILPANGTVCHTEEGPDVVGACLDGDCVAD